MEIMQIIGVAIITAVTAMLLRATKPELSFAVTVTGIIVILFFLVDELQGVLSVFSTIAQTTGVENGLLKILLKIVGVGYLTEFGAGIIQDFGAPAVADKVSLGGKITIVVMALPVFESLLTLIRNFIELV